MVKLQKKMGPQDHCFARFNEDHIAAVFLSMKLETEALCLHKNFLGMEKLACLAFLYSAAAKSPMKAHA